MVRADEIHNAEFNLLFMVLETAGEGISSPRTIIQTLEKKFSDHVLNHNLIKRKLAYAHRQGYLNRYGDDKHPHYQLSEAGEQRLAQLTFQSLRFDPKKWDQCWRILIFDIPEPKRAVRDMVRRLVKQAGMRKLQRSVWVTPFDCEKQFEILCRAYNIKQYLLLVETRNLPDYLGLRKYWNL